MSGSRFERSVDRLSFINTVDPLAEQASRIVGELQANGAELHYRAGAGDLLPNFTYELRRGGDRQRCRALIAEAKGGSPLLWAAVLQEIAMRSGRAE